MTEKVTIHFITTGGTIDKVYYDSLSTYQVGDPAISEVLSRSNVTLRYRITPLLKKDSNDLTGQDRSLIQETVLASPEDKIIITHGTDTITETGKLLKEVQNKTIVLTGSIAPAKFTDSDAVFNIGFAVAAVQTLPAGVYVTMNGRIFDPERARKSADRTHFEEISG
ncbi:MAG: asparaginase [Candidatus Dadabacteria bacterium]|nr:MAG: asparaginase [Candidatus Dadabacteria bacterium]